MAKADIPPGSILGPGAPVQATLQLGPPLLLEGVSSSHFQGPPSRQVGRALDESETSPVLATSQLCDWSSDVCSSDLGMTEDETVGWHHRLNGHEFE